MTDYYDTNGDESEYFDSFYTLPALFYQHHIIDQEHSREEQEQAGVISNKNKPSFFTQPALDNIPLEEKE